MKTIFQIPYLLSFTGSGKPFDYCMGNGSAGWTVASFGSAAEALAFAESIPDQSRMPCHPRLLAELRAAGGVR